jgi:hypothetical protein
MSELHPFINELVRRTTELGVKLRMVQAKHVVYEGTKCSGYFSHIPEPILAFPLKGSESETTMLHESQHMEQWHENCKVWRDHMVTSTVGAEDLLFLWIDGKLELTPAQARGYAQLASNVELDCDKRTVRLMKRLKKEEKTTIDVKVYTQKANAYAMFWKMVGESRHWYEMGRQPYVLPEVYEEFPNTFNLDYSELPRKFKRLFEKHCL